MGIPPIGTIRNNLVESERTKEIWGKDERS
jgi:hypothetical protein